MSEIPTVRSGEQLVRSVVYVDGEAIETTAWRVVCPGDPDYVAPRTEPRSIYPLPEKTVVTTTVTAISWFATEPEDDDPQT